MYIDDKYVIIALNGSRKETQESIITAGSIKTGKKIQLAETIMDGNRIRAELIAAKTRERERERETTKHDGVDTKWRAPKECLKGNSLTFKGCVYRPAKCTAE